MNGDIKLAALSDTDDTDVTGSELVTNGTFDSDTSGWTQAYVSVAPTTFSSVNGQLVARRGDQYRFAVQQRTVEVGKTYTVSVDSPTGDNLMVGKDSNSNQYGFIQTGAAGTGSVTFTATQTALYIMPHTYKNQTTDTIFDNISVRLAEEDRSVNGNGLQVFGSITKDPVATGADLVAYSGFDAASYLRQPYNPDLNPGTGAITTMGWYKFSGSSGAYRTLVYANTLRPTQGNIGSGHEGWQILIDPTDKIYYYVYGPTADANVTHGVTTNDGLWHFFCAVTENNSSHKLYVDGNLIGTNATTVGNLDNSLRIVELGVYGGTANDDSSQYFPFTGSLCNIRISRTAPSAEQIKKIYEDEKFLFQENAKCTLYGSSDAVTALAYDDSTELLHVGTSSGRSVFQGLQRIDNTTNAVGTAISAVDGMVVEE
jgi:hypothetical protein